jgi:hypothetical protein
MYFPFIAAIYMKIKFYRLFPFLPARIGEIPCSKASQKDYQVGHLPIGTCDAVATSIRGRASQGEPS